MEMSIIEDSSLMSDKLDELDTPLSLPCFAENLRMAVFHFDKARNLLEATALAFESNSADDLNNYIQSAKKHQAHALQYCLIAELMIAE